MLARPWAPAISFALLLGAPRGSSRGVARPMNKRSRGVRVWAGVAIFLIAVLSMTQIVRNEYPFFAGYVILQFIALVRAWSILGGYAG